MGTEAAAGKNPVSHVGKIYNVLAYQLAKQIYENTEGVREVYVLLLSQIGMPIDKPKLANVQMLLKRGQILKNVSAKAEETVAQAFKNIRSLCRDLAHGKYQIC
jgi:S-adenosylmethionine synthetase